MANTEMEVKFKLDGDRAARLFHTVFSKAATEGQVTRMVDQYFDMYKNSLRIRTIGGQNWVTFKGPSVVHEGGAKSRQELEFTIGPNKTYLEELFEAMGFKKSVTVTKTRYSLLQNDLELSYDWIEELNQAFLEVEAKTAISPEYFNELIKSLTQTLDLPFYTETRSYQEIVRDKVTYGIS